MITALRLSAIQRGEVVFEMNNVEVPKQWSQIATDILHKNIFVKPVFLNLMAAWAAKPLLNRWHIAWPIAGEYGVRSMVISLLTKDAQVFYEELVYSILNQMCVPNSPQWFNTGLYESYGIKGKPQGHYYVDPVDGELKKSTSAYERPQPHACFILSVDDDLVNDGGIMDLWVREARIFKYGSGRRYQLFQSAWRRRKTKRWRYFQRPDELFKDRRPCCRRY